MMDSRGLEETLEESEGVGALVGAGGGGKE